MVNKYLRRRILIEDSFIFCDDPDGEAFIINANITDPTQQGAICVLVKSLKTNNIWSKMKAIYPFVGGTASQHKFNLKNPIDTDAAFRLNFFGGLIHNSNGLVGNGIDGYADSNYIPSSELTLNSEHMSIYCNTDNNEIDSDPVIMGTFESIAEASTMIIKNSNLYGGRMNSEFINTANIDAKGFYTMTKNGNTTLNLYKDGVIKNSGTSSGTLPDTRILLLNMFFVSTPYGNGFSNQNISFATLGDGLSATDQLNLYNTIQTFQTTLGRNV